jgi:hypothetical protein
MEDHLTQSAKPTELKLNNQAIDFLKETAKWANFLAIMGFIGIGLLVIIALFAGTLFGSLPESNAYAEVGSGLIMLVYLLMAVLYIFPVLYLYRFADKMKTALARNDEDILSDALMNLKSHYKFIGILTIVMLAFYALGILLALIGGLAAM